MSGESPAAGSVRPVLTAVAVGTATVLPGFLTGAMSLQISRELGLGLDTLGLVTGSFFLAAAAGSTPGGALAQRVGAAPAMRAAAAGGALSLLGVAVAARDLPALIACLALGGLANAVAQPAINLFLAERAPGGRRGVVFAVKQSAIPLAVLLSGLALPLIALPLGWRWTYGCAAGLVALLALGLRARRSAGVPEAPPAPDGPARRPALRLLAGAAMLASAGPAALGAFLVTTAVGVGFSEGDAGLLLVAGSLCTVAVRLAAGWLADRRADHGLTPMLMMLVGGAGGFALIAVDAPAAVLAGAILAFALGWGWPGIFNLSVVSRHLDSPASASGVTQTGVYAGAAGGPVCFGLLAGATSLPLAWAVSGVVALLGAGLVWLADRRYREALA